MRPQGGGGEVAAADRSVHGLLAPFLIHPNAR